MNIRIIDFPEDLDDLLDHARWNEIGLHLYFNGKYNSFEVTDKQLFFLMAIKHGIVFEEIK